MRCGGLSVHHQERRLHCQPGQLIVWDIVCWIKTDPAITYFIC